MAVFPTISTLPDSRIEVYLAKYEFSAQHYLAGSDAQSTTIGELLEMATEEEREAFERLPLMYTPTWGTDRLRDAIAATYQRIDRDHILAFAGAEEAIFWVMQTLIGPSDHAVVVVPTYPSTETMALASGADVSGLALEPADGWALDPDKVRALLKPNTRLLAISFPNNPTGAMIDSATLGSLVELCEERGIWLLSDEVYRGLELDLDHRLPNAADLSPIAISINVMSKAYGLPGLRIGWIASQDREPLERLERRKQYTSVCNSGPSELLAAIALRNRASILDRTRSITADNVALFDAFFSRWSDLFEWERPQGGCVAFPRYLPADSADEFCQELVEQAGVALLPGSVFHSDLARVPVDRFRILLGRSHPEPGLDAFDAFLTDRTA
jgi:aspartate/methionine/tyrosine aminotransferase